MSIIQSIESMDYWGDAVITVGTFDGVHLGHQAIIQNLVQRAAEWRGRSLIVTFDEHPQTVLGKQRVQLLTCLKEKLELLTAIHPDGILVLPFTKELSQLSAEAFVVDLLHQRIGFKQILMGFNHTFGKKAEGGNDLVQKLGDAHGFAVETVAPVDVEECVISSTAIRRALLEGQVDRANAMLGRPYHIRGKVVEGSRIGRTIGFPTANLSIAAKDKLMPADGVYAVTAVCRGKRYSGMANMGLKPTVKGKTRSLEVHLFDFDSTLYHETMDVYFMAYLREEKKFTSLQGLQQQLKYDKLNSQQCLEESSKEAFDGFNQRRKN